MFQILTIICILIVSISHSAFSSLFRFFRIGFADAQILQCLADARAVLQPGENRRCRDVRVCCAEIAGKHVGRNELAELQIGISRERCVVLSL